MSVGGSSGDFVEFITDRGGKAKLQKSFELKSISAIAAREVAEGECSLIRTDTKDLTTPQNPISRP